MKDFLNIKSFYFECKNKIDFLSNSLEKACLCFVYNDIEVLVDEEHKSECVYPNETLEIEDAFHRIIKLTIYKFNNEDKFIENIKNLKSLFETVYVYSMAQDVFGEGRRCLVPIICEYYSLKNISSNSASSFLGGNKEIMFKLLEMQNIKSPRHLFFSEYNETKLTITYNLYSDIIVKPYNESASIGIELFKKSSKTLTDFLKYSRIAILKYKKILIEEFMMGDEIECTLFNINQNIVASPLVKIIKNCDYLDYKTVRYNKYGYEIYNKPIENKIINIAKKAYKVLDFNSLARFDFIVVGEDCFLFDITPNPTTSNLSTTNVALASILGNNSCVYELLMFIKLFIPTLNK